MKLEVALAQYTDALLSLKLAKSEPSEIEILHILVVRDAIQEALSDKTQLSLESLTKLLELDNFLKQQADAIARGAKLAEWRATFHPSTEAWWWFLEPTSDQEVSDYNPLDALFNGLTIAGLTGVAAHMTTFVQIFSTGGISFAETFGLLGQGGLLLTVIHTLQNTGQEKIKKILEKLNISPQFHSQATFGITAMLLLASVGVYHSLPRIGEWNYRQGEISYQRGLLAKAKAQYEQAAKIDPYNSEIQIALGKVYESLGDLKQASREYQVALEQGNVRAFNNLGRVYIVEKDLIAAESLLRIGLQRVTKEDVELNYELHQNLGWLLLERKQYQAAEKELRQAVAIDESIKEKHIGGGMAYCLLEDVLEDKKDKKDIKEQLRWKKMCLTNARPETIDQYKWFIETGKQNIADSVDTTGVVNAESKPSKKP